MRKTILAVSLVTMLGSTSVMAAAITPTYTEFGTLAGATFGGTGIDNSSVAISSSSNGGVVLGLTAHQRYGSSAVTNNGAGVFTAQSGIDAHAPSSQADPYATWNFAFYLGGARLAAYNYVLSYDFNAATGNDASTHGTVNVPGSLLVNSSLYQDSWNLGMDFLSTTAGAIVAPGGSPFDPTVEGQYTFSLQAFDVEGMSVARAAIQVNVVAAAEVPEPASIALVGLGLAGLAAVRRRRQA